MDFDTLLERYAELIVKHGLNVQPDQVVNISTEPIHRAFALKVARRAYQVGARFVQLDLVEPELSRIRILEAKEKDLKFVPTYVTKKYQDIVNDNWANLKLIGSEDPDMLADLDSGKLNVVRLHQHLAVQYFYEEGIGRSKIQWSLAALPTRQWAAKVFPNKDPDQALKKLWELIFACCRVDCEDVLAAWSTHNNRLHQRAAKLTALNIEKLHFVGPGTDLYVSLSPIAKFKGGTDITTGGVQFEPNIPTEEVFTTPDYRQTTGHVTVTRPFMLNGKWIPDLYLEFVNGQIEKFKASQNQDAFEAYINSDEGGRRLGEVALVGIDSPVYRSGVVFQEILLDENAACHIAVGSAYKFCLQNGETLTKDELAAVGCNESTVHTDMMISSDKVDVNALCYDSSPVAVIRGGNWTEDFK